jgi:acetoin utilization protein AcuB
MRLQDIMNRSVETISPADTVVLANEIMWRKQIHHLIVVDGQKVVGVLSDNDLGGPDAGEIPDNQHVRDVMTTDVVMGVPEMTVDRAINIFRERNLNCLPVIEKGRLIGIVTSTDMENLAKRGTSNHKYEGRDHQAYPPLQNLRGKSSDRSGHDQI